MRYLIINAKSGRLLDADAGSIDKNGTKVQLFGKLETGASSPNRQWYLKYVEDDSYVIANVQSGRLLDADSASITNDGTKVQLWDDGTKPANRRWRINKVEDDIFLIGNVQSARFLDADTGTIDQDGTKVQLWGTQAVENPNRLWKILKVTKH